MKTFLRGLRPLAGAAALASSVVLTVSPAIAVEGGLGAYFLGTRDTFAGFVPEPGTYTSLTFDHLDGSVDGVSLAGLPIAADADLELNLWRLGVTQVFDAQLFGGTPAINLTVPFPVADLTFTAIRPPLEGANIDDTLSSFGDLSLTGLVGWHRGNLHYSTGLTVYAPTGEFNTATINVQERTVQVLNAGKNVWSFQPFFAATWFVPERGFEVSGAASLLFSEENDATDYQTAPAFQLEGAVVQRFRSGWGVGLAGYTYHQLEDDSGAGAELTRIALGASSLRAQVSGIGPLVTYEGGTLLGANASLKLKYTHEFAAKRRFESNILTAVVSLAF
ncbi:MULTISPECIES: transporter [unclassified Ruegeria]|uniref:SphA family protein n=1 Tax=unclassified Ruegeria TaxID=2625375 RepID=UPI001AD9C24A|nr:MULTISPECIES: transporter [unclassified Ruegeria]MBO9410970.1 transporter [Ruegeria sp. R8_1]MBO9415171.1 transporter [Ruegeria sp. R8_2]